MAKVTLMDGIQSISGKLGNVCYRTHKNGTISISLQARKRSTPVSNREKVHRRWFGEVSSRVALILKDPTQRAAYEKQYRKRHKRNETLRQFVFRCVREEVGEVECKV